MDNKSSTSLKMLLLRKAVWQHAMVQCHAYAIETQDLVEMGL